VIVPKGTKKEEISEEMIMDCCREQMAGYKRPKKIVFIDEDDMPRTPTGKILHRKLREIYKD
jgi:acyl-CoA synthetase (AMP-forming)/AMP-acid ligase II